MGSGSFLWPKGCASIEDVPTDLLDAISHSLRILSWQENPWHGDVENIPPMWMWPFDEKIQKHFKMLDTSSTEGSGSDDKMPAADEVNVISNRLIRRD